MQASDKPEQARERILHIAAELFVQGGFRGTSVRSICERAGVNVAMVNYYFHSKEALYLEVVDYAHRQIHAETGVGAGEQGAGPREQLRLSILRMVSNLLTPGPSSLLTRLIAWELVEPSPAIARIAADYIQPMHIHYAGLVQAIAGHELSPGQLQRCAFSIIGQMVFYARSRPLHDLAAPELDYDQAGIAQIAAHIFRFSLAGLSSYDGAAPERH